MACYSSLQMSPFHMTYVLDGNLCYTCLIVLILSHMHNAKIVILNLRQQTLDPYKPKSFKYCEQIHIPCPKIKIEKTLKAESESRIYYLKDRSWPGSAIFYRFSISLQNS